MMKVVHISSSDTAGAGTCAYKLHRAMLEYGIESKMVVLTKTRDDDTVIEPFRKKRVLYKGIQKLFRIVGWYCTDYNKTIRKMQNDGACSALPVSIYDVSSLSVVKEADIIHLHWVDNFIDWRTFFKRVNVPVVWTLHDESFFYGISHYSDLFDLNNSLEQKYYKLKRENIKDAKNLHVVFLSKFFEEKFGNDKILSAAKSVRIINNSVDTSLFTMCDRDAAREKWGIDKTQLVLSFLANDIADRHKGLDILIKAVESMGRNNVKILAIGNDAYFPGSDYVRTTGVVRNPLELSELLSASDLYVIPSLQEAFSQSVIEAMACGCPAVAFPTGGGVDVVAPYNGILCREFTSEALKEGIMKAMETQYDRNSIRNGVMNGFSKDMIATNYINLYKEVL